MKDLKESYPIEVANFSKAPRISDETGFSWWVPYTMCKRDVILSALKSRIRKIIHKYGIENPKIIKHEHCLNKVNSNNFWRDANTTKMHNDGVEFEVLPEVYNPLVGWSNVTGNLIWDVKMDFTRKARWILDGHKNPDPIGSTYAR